MYRVSNDDPHKPNETKSFLPRLLANTCVSDFFRLALLYARDRQVHIQVHVFRISMVNKWLSAKEIFENIFSILSHISNYHDKKKKKI